MYEILPELLVLAGSLLTILLFPKSRGWGPVLFGLATLGLADWFLIKGLMGSGPVPVTGVFDVTVAGEAITLLSIDPLATFLKVLFVTGTAVVLLALPGTMRVGPNMGEAVGLLLLGTLGTMVVTGSQDLVTLFLAVEIVSFSGYILAGYLKQQAGPAEAASKYFITGALASGVSLFGMSLLFGITGSLRFDALSGRATEIASWVLGQGATPDGLAATGLFILVMLLVMATFAFKMAAVPLHWWAPDVYQGSPDAVAAWLSGAGKVLALAALFKVFLVGLFPYRTGTVDLGVNTLDVGWISLLSLLAIVTMTWGNLAALRQTDMKRMLAYSSIGQAGYILIALPVATVAVAQDTAIAGAVFHTATNVAMKGGAFLVVAALGAAGVGSSLEHYRGAGRRYPFLGIAMAVFLLSLAGIPPLAGFFSKFVLFSSAVQAATVHPWMLALVIFGVLNSAVSLAYYARWIGVMFFDADTHPIRNPVPFGATLAVLVSLVFTVLMGLMPSLGADPSFEAALALVLG